MTALNIVCQPNRGLVHVATDAAMYLGQRVVSFGAKLFPVPSWPGVMAGAGNSLLVPRLGWELAQDFQSFDELIDGVERVIERKASECRLPNGGMLIFAGISKRRGPEAYVLQTDDALPPGVTAEQAAASDMWPDVYKLVRLPDSVQSPVPNDQVAAANYQGIDVDAPASDVIWSIRQMLEMQRQTKLPPGIGGIGGYGQLATVSESGIALSTLQHWPEDQIDTTLAPSPIDWNQWHRDNPKPGMSRLQRERLTKKLNKRH